MHTTSDAARAGVITAFAADSLSLGAHWIYDAKLIADQFGRTDTLAAPLPGSYHKNRGAGDFTHYGDQTYTLLESLAATGSYDPDDFFQRWKHLFADYDGYVDGATRKTLERIDFGEGPESSGSNSSDLAGASRIAPLVAAHHEDLAELVQAARAQTRMTHNNPRIVEAAEFFARAAHAALEGAAPLEALREAMQAEYLSAPIPHWIDKGTELAQAETVAAIAQFGQSCNVEGAFPGVVQIIARHGDDPAEALVQNVMAGGDSAARGMLIGLILGCAHGPDAVPQGWVDGMTKAAAIQGFAAKLG